MRITFKLYASLMTHLPAAAEGHRVALTVADDATPIQILEQHGVPLGQVHLVLINGVFVPPGERNRPLHEDDELAVWPAVAGG